MTSSLTSKSFNSICDLFDDQVRKNPNAIAAVFEESCVTYLELDRRANQFAHCLRANGVGAETLVGLSLHNSLDLLAGILGILKSGGAYLPLDPNYPKERVRYMLEDARPLVLLTEGGLLHLFEDSSCRIIRKDEVDQMSTSACDGGLEPNQLAYVIYTSGSTGKPKGIMVEHASLSHAAVAHVGFYPEKPIALVSSGISFDPTLLILFHTLVAGGTVCLPGRDIAIDAEKTIDLIERHSIDFLLCVPSFYTMLLSKLRSMPSLKHVSLAGENIPNSLPHQHAALAPNSFLYNEYGPTEYAIGTTIGKIVDPVFRKIDKITVGKPLPNTEVYILDEDFKPTESGVKGELLIGGIGIARGYWNQPELTREKFVTVPHRLYRTGDFGRFLPDGQIEFLGRMDYQVKIRGHRVELGEIETVASQCLQVDEVVVVVQGEGEEVKRLVMYFSALSEGEVTDTLKNHLSDHLPKHMIPSAFFQMKSWPRTPNGKIDRANLPKLPAFLSINSAQPSSDLERSIFTLWKEILQLEHFGIHDNFFDLGGDSLQVAELQTHLRVQLGFAVGITEIFQYPTISLLAGHLGVEKEEEERVASQELAEKKKSAFDRFKKKRA